MIIQGGQPVTETSLGDFQVDKRTSFDDKKYSILINGMRINHVMDFNLRRSIQNFIGDFSIKIGNRENFMVPFIRPTDEVKIFRDGKTCIFHGRIEDMETSGEDVQSTITITGRDIMSDLLEHDAEFATYKNMTDNAIIQKIITKVSKDYKFELGEPQKITEYEIGPGDTIEAVVKGVANENGYFLWRNGNILKKGRMATEGPTKFTFYGGGLHSVNRQGNVDKTTSNILDIRIKESAKASKTKLKGYSIKNSKSKASLSVERTINMFKDGTFATIVFNKARDILASTLKRESSMGLSGKNQADMNKEIDRMALESQLDVTISIKTRNFLDIDLNDIVHVQNDFYGIDNRFAVGGILYTLTDPSMETTELTLQPLGSYPR